MSERKVINKYFPPDFDPAKIPRRKLKDKNNQQVVRLMAPFSMRCNSCGEYIYKGKKFNARKETVEGEDYFGIRIFRFYIKCTLCSTEITFKTDPKNADYLAEHGASRNFESWRDDKAEQDAKAYMPNAGEDDEEDGEDGEGKKRREEAEDAMKALETSTENSKREMDILDALQDIRNRNARNERISTTANPSSILSSGAAGPSKPPALTPEEMLLKQQEEEDEELVRAVFSKIPLPPSVGGATVAAANGKGKGREALAEGGLGGEYGSDSEGEGEGGEEGDDPSSSSSSSAVPPPPLPSTAPTSLSIKRKTLAGGPGDAGGEDEPTLARLMGEKGVSVGAGSGGGFGFGKAAAPKKKAKIGLPGLKKK